MARVLNVCAQSSVDRAVIAKCVHGFRRNGIDGVLSNERIDVERIGILRILYASRCPQQTLRHRAFGLQRLPAIAHDHRLIPSIGELRICDCNLAAKRAEGVAFQIIGCNPIVDCLVDLGINATDEEAGDARNPIDRLALGNARFKTREKGLSNSAVRVDREQQCDVDVDAIFDQRADSRNSGLGARHLDHQIGLADCSPQASRLFDCRIGIERQVG